MLLLRGLLALAIGVCGTAILAEMARSVPQGGFAVVPGVVLGGAMVAFGGYRLSLIMRALRARGDLS